VLLPDATNGGAYVHVEELETDTRTLARPAAKRFLRECHVPAAKAAWALERAGGIAASAGTAVIRVAFEPDGAKVSVTAPDRAAAPRTHAGATSSTEQPLLAALAAG
jgi:hypothetical protein